MALYLGNKRVCPIIGIIGSKSAEGTVTSDSDGYVVLPKLDFVPKTIVLYKYTTYINGAEDPGGGSIPFRAYAGTICTYIDVGETVHSNDSGTWQSNWISMVLYNQSGQFAMAGVNENETLQNGAVVTITGSGSYRLHTVVANNSINDNENLPSDVTNVEFYYRAYA